MNAFPVSDLQGASPRTADELKALARGMTLRDYFAAKALSGLCANPGGPYQANDRSGWSPTNTTLDQIADECYALADAMLKRSA